MNLVALASIVPLLLANGFFVAAEFAYIAARRNSLEQRRSRSARAAVRLSRDLSLSLAAAQLGITVATLLLGFVAEPAIAGILEAALGFVQLSGEVLHTVALVIALIIVTFLHMVVGEMAPKNIAIADPERSALVMALPFQGFLLVFRPVIAVLNGTANAVLRLFRVPPTGSLEKALSAEDLATIIAAGRREGVIRDFAHRLLTGAIVFGDRDASAVMVPRPDVKALPSTVTVAEVESLMRSTGHSRIPIHAGDLDEVLGFVHVKDLLAVDDERHDEVIDPSLLRPLMPVPESAPVQAVLDAMRRERSHMAVVVDEHGGTAGLITLEDIAEELVGEIRDEHDPRELPLRRLANGLLRVPGATRLGELESLGLRLPPGEYDTVGGLVMDRLGRVPRQGDLVGVGGLELRVRAMDGRRVAEVELRDVDGQGFSTQG